MFYKSENSDSVRPSEIENDKYVHFVRKDFKFVDAVTMEHQERPAHWEYLETKIPNDQWNIYLMAQGAIDYVNAMEG